jgi:acetoin utilization protein AcuB
MIAEDLISDFIIPLKRNDSCEAAIGFMREVNVTEMPVVEQGKLLGYLQIVKAEKTKAKTVGEIMSGEKIFVYEDTHLFDVAKIMLDSEKNTLAVCDTEQNYKGSITLTDLLKGYTKETPLSLQGAIVTLQIIPRDYTLTEIARITESNDFKITGIFIRTLADNKLEVNIKFNSTEINAVLHAFERFNYEIKSVHQLSEAKGGVDDRFDWLIKYINT